MQQIAAPRRPWVVTMVPVDAEQQENLAEYVRQRGDWLAKCAYLLTSDREMALDLVQDTLLLAWKAATRVEQADDRDAYVLRIMLNRHRSNHRRSNPATISLDLPRFDVAYLSDPTEKVDDAQAVGEALKTLSARQRAVVVLRYWMDLDDLRIAEVMGCRRATVRSLAARGMKRIKQFLESP